MNTSEVTFITEVNFSLDLTNFIYLNQVTSLYRDYLNGLF